MEMNRGISNALLTKVDTFVPRKQTLASFGTWQQKRTIFYFFFNQRRPIKYWAPKNKFICLKSHPEVICTKNGGKHRIL